MPASKPLTDRIASIKEQKDKLLLKLNKLEAKAKQEERARITHREIVTGRAVLAHMQQDKEFAEMVRLVLSVSVTRPADKAVIPDLLDDQAPPAAAQTLSR